MNKYARHWLALLTMAVAITGTSPCRGAETPGPEIEKTPPPQSEQPGPAQSGTTPPATKRSTYPFRGKVASYDAGAQALKLEGKTHPRVVHLTAQTRLMKRGQPAIPEDLKAGEMVGGTLRKNAEGREEALLIRIGPKPDATGPDGPAAAPIGKAKEATE